MRRLLRRAFRLAAAVSAVLLICECVLWAWAWRRGGEFAWRSSVNHGCCESVRENSLVELAGNGVGVWVNRDDRLYPAVGLRPDLSELAPPYRERSVRWWHGGPAVLQPWHEIGPGVAPGLAKRLGLWFEYQHITEAPGEPYLSRNYWHLDFGLPHWLLCMMAVVLPVRVLAKWHRPRSRQRKGLCPACGYDLRATPEGGGTLLDRCPECGVEGAVPRRA